ncbi:hypothetical protein E6O75_ATG10638 [Venturia nashicola]|uniref:Uncharacterized protein n=1 Tax=Venturia nashicola TaxID=86259 RepID=A0A4Z1P7G8_9PEZI|nr:hypothetical protein E6O75_ATG10638 [Venturia nashicola]
MANSSSNQPSDDPPINPPIDPTEDATFSYGDSDSDDESWSLEYTDTPPDDEEHEADVQETSGRGRFALTSGPATDGPWHGGNGMRRTGRGADRRTWWRQWMEMKRPRLRRAEQWMFWVWLI